MTDKILAMFQNILLGILGGLIAFLIMQHMVPAQKQLVKIDVSKIVNNYIQNAANKHLSKEKLEEETKRFAKNLESKLQILAERERIIVLPSQAIIAGGNDYTEQVEHEIKY